MPWTTILIAAAGLALVVVAYVRHWSWTGFTGGGSAEEASSGSRTLWDWLELLLVPAGIAVVIFLLNDSQAARDRAIAEDRARDDTLRTYLQQMSNLVLDRHLRTSGDQGPVRQVATTLTVTVLPQLDGPRKGAVVRFLSNAGLVKPPSPIIVLEGADLRGVALRHTLLPSLSLRGSNLQHADFSEATLPELDLSSADLRGADFHSAVIGFMTYPGDSAPAPHYPVRGSRVGLGEESADFGDADARGADFGKASISSATFGFAKLGDADFQKAHVGDTRFLGACLSGATFADADISMTSFSEAQGVGVSFRSAMLEASTFGAAAKNGPTRLARLDFTKAKRVNTPWPKGWRSDGLALTAAAEKRLCRFLDQP